MYRLIKSTLLFLIVVGTAGGVFGWMLDRPNQPIWAMRIVGPLVALISLGIYLKLHLRRDLETDYLRQLDAYYFNRNGLCLSHGFTKHNGLAYMLIYFQSQFDKPSLARVVIIPDNRKSISGAKQSEPVEFEIDCPAAGFGYARKPIAIARELQGKDVKFHVGATVEYPAGKGRRVRFRDGIDLKLNHKLQIQWWSFRTLLVLLVGRIFVASLPISINRLPTDVADEIPPNLPQDVKILWKLGDPPLQNAG